MERKSSSRRPPLWATGRLLRRMLSGSAGGPDESAGVVWGMEVVETSTTSGSWCTNLYLRPGVVVLRFGGVLLVGAVRPHRRSTIRAATGGDVQTLQSIIHTMSPFASRYARLMFRILGLGPRFVVRPSRPERFGSSSSTSIFASKAGKSKSRSSRIEMAGSLRDEMQKYIVSRSRG